MSMTFIQSCRVGISAVEKDTWYNNIYYRIECEHECYLYKEGYLKTHTTRCELVEKGLKGLWTYRNEQIRDPPLVLCPSLAILLTTALHISPCPMYNHRREKGGVEPRKWAVEASYKTPRQSLHRSANWRRDDRIYVSHKVEIARVVDLSRVCIPPIY